MIKHFLYMNYGPTRRQVIAEYAMNAPWGLHVNRKHCPQLKHDPDLKYMLKKGILVRQREYRGNPHCRVTVLYHKDHPMVSLA
jgi:hypothetical protein